MKWAVFSGSFAAAISLNPLMLSHPAVECKSGAVPIVERPHQLIWVEKRRRQVASHPRRLRKNRFIGKAARQKTDESD